MRIVVCIKQVPATTEVKIDPETKTLVRQGVESQINPFDTYALEEAVRLREKLGKGTVTVLSMGPPQAEAALREAISLGADNAVLLCDRAFAGSDTWATSYCLSMGIRKLGADLVICGQQAIDGDTGQTGPGIATQLDIPQATYVAKVVEIQGRKLTVERLVETGRQKVEVQCPALLTVVKEINEPRTPSLKGKMAAKKAEIPKWGIAELGMPPELAGLKGSPTQVVEVFAPPRRGGGEKWQGESAEMAEKLAGWLKEQGVL